MLNELTNIIIYLLLTDEEQAESEKAMTDQDGRSQMSENEFMEALTEQAREIAKAVLAGDEAAGTDLAHDAKVCVTLTVRQWYH